MRKFVILAAAALVLSVIFRAIGPARQQSEAATTSGPPLAGMPPVLDPSDIYAADRPGRLSPAVRGVPQRLYVPNAGSDSVDVIDPKTRKVVDHYPVGKQPQHVVPSYDLKTLWVTNDKSNSLTPVDPRTGKVAGSPVPVDDPYNMYFTPDGRYAIVVAEQLQRLDFRDAHTMALHRSLRVPCRGVDHLDFSADGRFLLASCEFEGKLIRVDVAKEQLTGLVSLPRGNLPQDVKLAPDGQTFYVADQRAAGVYLIDATSYKVKGFVPTGPDAHGLYVSRDSKRLYVTNRGGGGSVSVIDFATNKVAARWRVPGGGSPDMGGVSADGKTLWVTGRYNAEIYGFDTSSGRLVARIRVGVQPHGMAVFVQPGRYSTGHTGVFR